MKYKFKAKDLKTGEWVEGDLAYVHQWYWRTRTTKIKPMLVRHHAFGGRVYISSRHFVVESTIELIKEE